MAYTGGYDWDEHNRQALLRGQQILDRTSESISNSRQIAIETEQVGTGVMNELSEQRESLLRSRNRLQNMDEELSKSRRLIRAMGRHVFYNKIILILIILIEAGILGGLVYLKFFKK